MGNRKKASGATGNTDYLQSSKYKMRTDLCSSNFPNACFSFSDAFIRIWIKLIGSIESQHNYIQSDHQFILYLLLEIYNYIFSERKYEKEISATNMLPNHDIKLNEFMIKIYYMLQMYDLVRLQSSLVEQGMQSQSLTNLQSTLPILHYCHFVFQ